MRCRWVPEEYRARALTLIHSSFSLGTVFGMLATPQLVLAFGWPGALMGFTLLGLAWAVSCPDLPMSDSKDGCWDVLLTSLLMGPVRAAMTSDVWLEASACTVCLCCSFCLLTAVQMD